MIFVIGKYLLSVTMILILYQVSLGLEVLVQLGSHLGRRSCKRGVKRRWRGGGVNQSKFRALGSDQDQVELQMEVEE